MEGKTRRQKSVAEEKVKVLGATFEEGKPHGETMGMWRQKLESRQERVKYLESAERYWYSRDWHGSEKRKKPA